MKSLKILTIIAAATLCGAPISLAQTSWVYDGNGNLAGSIQSAGPNANFIYDNQGNLAGSTANAGNSTYLYGSNGGYVGAVIPNQNLQRELDMR